MGNYNSYVLGKFKRVTDSSDPDKWTMQSDQYDMLARFARTRRVDIALGLDQTNAKPIEDHNVRGSDHREAQILRQTVTLFERMDIVGCFHGNQR